MTLTASSQKKTRVLVVDDSSVIRGLLVRMLRAREFIEILDTASDGQQAVKKAKELTPDVLLLDIEMPIMNGLEALPEILKASPSTRVIMVSSLTSAGSKSTVEALTLGATDFVAKPSARSFGGNRASIEEEIIEKIKKISPPDSGSKTKTQVAQPLAELVKLGANRKKPRPSILLIGSSTGGPHALGQILPHIRKDYPIPIAIVQHMPPLFTRLLAERIEQDTGILTKEAEDGDRVKPGKILIAPGDHHMILKGTVETSVTAHLNQSEPVNYCRPAIDPLLKSAVEIYGTHTAAVILTGMGKDGLRGCQAIHQVGGQIITQDEATSVVSGMPGAVAKDEIANHILPLGEIGSFLDELV